MIIDDKQKSKEKVTHFKTLESVANKIFYTLKFLHVLLLSIKWHICCNNLYKQSSKMHGVSTSIFPPVEDVEYAILRYF